MLANLSRVGNPGLKLANTFGVRSLPDFEAKLPDSVLHLISAVASRL
jgi:hypothetical protein